jgi:hypothetical protein
METNLQVTIKADSLNLMCTWIGHALSAQKLYSNYLT